MARRRAPDEYMNTEAWAIPFGDLMTLLLAFFVVMYAISSVNSGKYRVLSAALTAEFRGTPRTPQPIAVGETPENIREQLPITEVNRLFSAGMPAHARMPLPLARGTVRNGERNPGSADPRSPPNAALAESEAARQKELAEIEADVSGVLASLIKSNSVNVHKQGDSVQVQISADLLFASGMAEPAAAARPILQRLADSLKPWPNGVRVEGHTDDVPIRSSLFHSNWELSAARAGSVVRLFSERGVDPQRLAVVGYGQYHPLQANTTASGRNANRRVAVIILGRHRSGDGANP